MRTSKLPHLGDEIEIGREPGAISLGSQPLDGGEMLGSYQATKALGRYIAFPPKLARVIGIEETIFLLNFLYAASDEEEWVLRTAEELEHETTLTYKQQVRVRNHLSELGLLEEKTDRRKHLMYYRVIEAAYDALLQTLKRKFDELTFGSNSTLPKGVSLNLPNGSSLLKKEEEVQEQEEEVYLSTPKQEDVNEVYKEMKRYYRRNVSKGLGKVPPSRGLEFVDLVEKKTGDVMLAVFQLWVDENKAWLKKQNWPMAVFMKNVNEQIEAYEDKIAGEQEQEDEEQFPQVKVPD